MKSDKQNDDCKIHGTSSRSVNKTLLFLLLGSFSLIIWHVWMYGPSGKPLALESSQTPFLMLLGSELWDLVFGAHGIVAELQDIFPYFLFGVLLAGFIRTYKLAITLRNSLVRYGPLSIVLASLVGVLTPLCACGILTTAITLLFAGVPLAPVMALLVSSPLISPSAYLLTLSDLGPQWTVIRTVSAFSMGIFAGIITHIVRNKGFQTETLLLEGAVPEGDFHDQSYPEDGLRCNCKEKFGNRVARKTDHKFIIFWAKSFDMLWLVGKYVLVGVVIGSVVERYMPSEWIYRMFGRDDKFNIVWITVGTVPIFLHQISASSVLYHIKSTLDGTLNGGAGLAFLIGGPVTAIPTMIMLWSIFKKRVFFLYMFICIIGTILLAYSFQYFVLVPHVDTDNPLLAGVRSLSGGSSSVISKADKYVRIVMDPDGKGMIALYDNYLEGKGGVVFDGGFERFLDDSFDRFDNRRYVKNVADWLEGTVSSTEERNILIYNTYYKNGLDNSYFSLNASSISGQEGEYSVHMTDRDKTPKITELILREYSQLWIFLGESDQECCFSDTELETMYTFMDEGRGVLIVAGQHGDAPTENWSTANRIASGFGVTFTGSAENREELTVSTSYYFTSRLSEHLEWFYRFIN